MSFSLSNFKLFSVHGSVWTFLVVCLAQLKPSLGVLSVFLHIDHLGWSSTSHRQMKQNVGGG